MFIREISFSIVFLNVLEIKFIYLYCLLKCFSVKITFYCLHKCSFQCIKKVPKNYKNNNSLILFGVK